MSTPAEEPTWDVQVRPRMMPLFAYGAAAFIAVAHLVMGILLKIKATGVFFRASDQVAIIGLGLILAGAVLLLTRPRLRVGAAGISVRNLFGDRLIPWSQVVDVYFPAGKRWARLELPSDEYIPVMAIQALDKERAVAAMRAVRQLVDRYRPSGARQPPASAGS